MRGALAGIEDAVGVGDGGCGETGDFLPGIGDADEFLRGGRGGKAGGGGECEHAARK